MTIVRYNKKRELDIEADTVRRVGAMELMQDLPDSSTDALISDPPFFTGIARDDGGFGGDPWNEINSLHAASAWATPLMEQAFRVVRPGGAVALMCGVHASAAWMLAAENAGLKWMAELMVLWNTGKPRVKNFGSLHTHIQWFTRPGARHTWNSHRKSFYSNIIVCTKIPVGHREHISQKPVELTNFLVSLLTRADGIVVDPFCGSGSTLVSAELTNRHYIGGDKDAKHVATAKKRLMHPDVEHENPLYFWINGRLEEI